MNANTQEERHTPASSHTRTHTHMHTHTHTHTHAHTHEHTHTHTHTAKNTSIVVMGLMETEERKREISRQKRRGGFSVLT